MDGTQCFVPTLATLCLLSLSLSLPLCVLYIQIFFFLAAKFVFFIRKGSTQGLGSKCIFFKDGLKKEKEKEKEAFTGETRSVVNTELYSPMSPGNLFISPALMFFGLILSSSPSGTVKACAKPIRHHQHYTAFGTKRRYF